MHPCESPLLFVFWNLPCFSFLVSNYFDWFKQPFCFTLHAHLLLWHMYYTYIASLCGGFYGCLCTELFSVIFITPIAWAKFYLTKPRLQNNLVWCGQGLTISLPSTGSTVSNHFFLLFPSIWKPYGLWKKRNRTLEHLEISVTNPQRLKMFHTYTNLSLGQISILLGIEKVICAAHCTEGEVPCLKTMLKMWQCRCGAPELPGR